MGQIPPASSSVPAVLAASEGEARWFLGELAILKITSEMTGGRFAAVEFMGAMGSETPPHTHRREDEVFLLLEGEMTFRVGDRLVDAGAGHVVLAPKDLPHAYVVRSERARWLVMTFPAGFERFVREASAPARELRLPRPGEPQGDEGDLRAIAKRHGIEFA